MEKAWLREAAANVRKVQHFLCGGREVASHLYRFSLPMSRKPLFCMCSLYQ